MVIKLYTKRILFNKLFWLSVMAALFLLMGSTVYVDILSGKQYMFYNLIYDDMLKELVYNGQISLHNIMLGFDSSYLWMFCPIIVGIPCIMTKKIERFVLFRSDKRKYVFGKFFLNILAGGLMLFIAYLVYVSIAVVILKDNIWDINLVKKMLSVFCWGIMSAIPCNLLCEFLENKYLILCIPFVLNYFMYMFVPGWFTYDVGKYIDPSGYQIFFLHDKKTIITYLLISAFVIGISTIFKWIMAERRCDCGQK
ncbi:MAG: hypothetical protein J6L69_06800 [Lachnospiraceae bacterium]|nr:hypothetical protein [Lachnospiraceae bacterium]